MAIRIPFVGRLSLYEWHIIIVSFTAIYIEFIITVITAAIPSFLIQYATNALNWVYNLVLSKDDFTLKKELKEGIQVRNKIRSAIDIHEIGRIFGYDINNHVVTTTDGYILTLHRIKPLKSNAPIIYLHHGLLMCSDIWVCKVNKFENLPFVLHELGFDVWLGNNRGNKYSSKHLNLKPTDSKFWDFSIDEFALYDIPDSIGYVLNYTKLKKLTYIGFSQGSAQAFAALSINPKLNEQVDLFIAISPAMTPKGLHHRVVDVLIKTSPNIMFLIFGKRTLLPSASFWENIIYPPLFIKVIDFSNDILFNWKSLNIDYNSKISCYAHLYSPTSVKSIVHWFQIIRNSKFQMYDEVVSITSLVSRAFQPLNFPTKTNIQVPIRIIYGKVDSLVDIEQMLKLIPESDIKSVGIPAHEHLDLIWGDGVKELVIPHVLEFLNVNLKPEANSLIDYEKVTSLVNEI